MASEARSRVYCLQEYLETARSAPFKKLDARARVLWREVWSAPQWCNECIMPLGLRELQELAGGTHVTMRDVVKWVASLCTALEEGAPQFLVYDFTTETLLFDKMWSELPRPTTQWLKDCGNYLHFNVVDGRISDLYALWCYELAKKLRPVEADGTDIGLDVQWFADQLDRKLTARRLLGPKFSTVLIMRHLSLMSHEELERYSKQVRERFYRQAVLVRDRDRANPGRRPVRKQIEELVRKEDSADSAQKPAQVLTPAQISSRLKRWKETRHAPEEPAAPATVPIEKKLRGAPSARPVSFRKNNVKGAK